MDLSKTFNTVDYTILIQKLGHYRIKVPHSFKTICQIKSNVFNMIVIIIIIKILEY